MPKPLRLAVSVAVAGLLGSGLAACSDNNGSSSKASSAPPGSGATVNARTVGDLGSVLVNDVGRTLYLFQADAPGMSACSGACAVAWPPLTVTGAPTAGTNVDGGKLGTITRADGMTEVTYNGHPLYTFAADTRVGATNGQGLDQFGGRWWAVSPSGDAVTVPANPGRGGGGY